MLEELTPGTTYYVTAYAVNEKGTGYSNVKEFKTMELTVPRLDALVISTPKRQLHTAQQRQRYRDRTRILLEHLRTESSIGHARMRKNTDDRHGIST